MQPRAQARGWNSVEVPAPQGREIPRIHSNPFESFAPLGLGSRVTVYPGLAPGATFLRRSAATFLRRSAATFLRRSAATFLRRSAATFLRRSAATFLRRSAAKTATSASGNTLFPLLIEVVDVSALVQLANKTVVDVVFHPGFPQLVFPQSGMTIKQHLRVPKSFYCRIRLGREVPGVVEKFLHPAISNVVVPGQGSKESLFILFDHRDRIHHGFDEAPRGFTVLLQPTLFHVDTAGGHWNLPILKLDQRFLARLQG